MEKIIEVVMVPTEKAVDGGIIKLSGGTLRIAERANLGNKIFDAGVSYSVYAGSYQPQHLHFLSNEKPIDGDWIFNKMDGTPIRYDYHQIDGDVRDYGYKKVIGSTDKSLKIPYDGTTPISKDWSGKSLPRPSNEFLKKFCEVGGIWEVSVEYEAYHGVNTDLARAKAEKEKDFTFMGDYYDYRPKVAPDNTLIIKPVAVESHGKPIGYWKENASEDYVNTPISVLKYITVLEEELERLSK